MRFRAEILLEGKTATGIRVPEEVITALGGGKRPPVVVTLNEHTYRTTVGSVRGVPMIPVSAEHRRGSGVAAGDEVDVGVELDTEPRVVAAPDDLAEALREDPAASGFFERLAPSHRKAYVVWIESAKKPETRERRVTQAVEMLREGRTR